MNTKTTFRSFANPKLLFSISTDNFYIQLFRYFWVGGVAFLVDFGALFTLTDILSIHYLYSAAVAFMCGLAVNFIISILWVFPASNINNRWVEFLLFGLVGILGLGVNEAIIYLFTDVLGIHYLYSKMISTGFVFFWNFLLRRTLLYRK